MKEQTLNNPFTDLPKGIVDSSDYNNIIKSTELAIPNDLGNGVSIKNYQLIVDNGRHYLETIFDVDLKDIKNIGFKNLTRRYFLNVKMDSVTGNFVDCYSETGNQIRSIAQLTCNADGGVINPGSDMCTVGDQTDPIEEEQEECGPGANYKLVYEKDQLKLKCTPCETQEKFVRWDCQKGKYVGLKGVNWVNVCYYKTGCKESAIANFGSEFFIQGPTDAKGGDTGTKKNCRKKRKPCPGEIIALKSSELIAIESSMTAQNEVQKAAGHLQKLSGFASNNNGEKVLEAFSDLKVAADAAVTAANRSQEAAEIAKTDKANAAADRAMNAKINAEKYYKDGLEILSKFI